MIKIVGNDIMRGGEKIGYFSGNDIYSYEGKKLGYFEGNDIYDNDNRKLGYLEGDFIKTAEGKNFVMIEDNRKEITGGAISDLERAAIRFLF